MSRVSGYVSHGRSSDNDSGVGRLTRVSSARDEQGAKQAAMFAQSMLVLENRGLADAGVAKVARKLRSNDKVTSVDLRNNNIGDAGARDLAGMLSQNSSLCHLMLADNNIGDSGCTELMGALLRNTTLVRLDLRFNSITHQGAAAVCEMLCHNSSLRKLDLQLNTIGRQGAASIAKGLERNNALKTLALGFNNVGDQGAAALGAALKVNDVLKSLHLPNNNIGNEGTRHLTDALGTNSTLTDLDIHRNDRITEAGLRDFEAVLESQNRTLTRLDLGPLPAGIERALARNRALSDGGARRPESAASHSTGHSRDSGERVYTLSSEDGTPVRRQGAGAPRPGAAVRSRSHSQRSPSDDEWRPPSAPGAAAPRRVAGSSPAGPQRGGQRAGSTSGLGPAATPPRGQQEPSRYARADSGQRRLPAPSADRPSIHSRGSSGWNSGAEDARARSRTEVSRSHPTPQSAERRHYDLSGVPAGSPDTSDRSSEVPGAVLDPQQAQVPPPMRNGSHRAAARPSDSRRPLSSPLRRQASPHRRDDGSRRHGDPHAGGGARRSRSAQRSIAGNSERGRSADGRGDGGGSAEDVSRLLHESRQVPSTQRLPDGAHHSMLRDYKPLSALRQLPVTVPSADGGDAPLHSGEHCIVLVDRAADPRLRVVTQRCNDVVAPIFDIKTRVQSLALLVSAYMGGVGSIAARHRADVARRKRELSSNVVPLCAVEVGGARHRALLFKYLCDHVGIACSVEQQGQGAMRDHLSNAVQLGMNRGAVVDLVSSPGALYPADSAAAQQYRETAAAPPPEAPDGDRGSDDGGAPPSAAVQGTRYFCLPDSTMTMKRHGKLGGGATGAVFRCTLGGVTFAMKKVQMSQGYQRRIREIVILEQLCHENVVRYLGHEVASENEVFIFMEYLPWSLHSWMRKLRTEGLFFRERDMLNVALDIIKGLHYLHEKAPLQIVHRDLKSKNILLDVDADDEIKEVKLCDFGVSKIVTQYNRPETMVGTYYWMAPEILRNDHTEYTVKADIWSFGMVCVELLTLRNPYYENGNDWPRTKDAILRGVPPKLPSNSPRKMRDVIVACLRLRPDDRPTTRDIMIRMISD